MKKIISFICITFFSFNSFFLESTYAEGIDLFQKKVQKQNRASLTRQHDILSLLNRLEAGVVGELIRFLDNEDPIVRYAAVWALNPSHMNLIDFDYSEGVSQLSEPQLPRMIEALLSMIGDKDHWVQTEAMDALIQIQTYQKAQGINPDIRIKKTLINQIKNPDPHIRALASWGLLFWRADLKAEEAERLAFKDEVGLVRRGAVEYFKNNFDILSQAIKDPNPEIRIATVRFLIKFHSKNFKTLDLLVEKLGDPHGIVVMESIHALGLLKDTRAVGSLLDFREKNKRWSVDKAIKEITGKTLDEVLKDDQRKSTRGSTKDTSITQVDPLKWIKMLQEGDKYQKKSAALELSWMQPPNSVDILLECLLDRDIYVQYSCAKALSGYILSDLEQEDKLKIFEHLLRSANSPDQHVRRAVVGSIGAFIFLPKYESDVIHFINNAIDQENNPFVILSLISNASATKNKSAGPIFLKLVNHEFPKIRESAIYGMSLDSFPKAIGPTIAALKDPIFSVRFYALQNLSSLNSYPDEEYQRLLNVLQELAKSAPSQKVRKKANFTIKKMESIKPLIRPTTVD